MSVEDGTFLPKVVMQQMFLDALNKYEGVFNMEVDPGDLKRAGKIEITLRGVPKDDS